MMQKKVLDDLRRYRDHSAEAIADRENVIKSKGLDVSKISLRLAARNAVGMGLYDFYARSDVVSCKQWFYLSARLREESCKSPEGWDMGFVGPFIYALLSDCKYLIDCYGQLNTIAIPHSQLPSYKESVFRPDKYDARYLTHYLQAIIRRDWALMNEIERQAREKLKKPHKSALYWFQVGGALQRSDKDEIIRVINELLNPRIHKAFNEERVEELCGQVWSHHPVMFTKLAWMHGLEIEIDSPLVPMELMPIRPLEHYDDVYDFLKPGYVPLVEKPKKSFLDRVFRR